MIYIILNRMIDNIVDEGKEANNEVRLDDVMI